MTPAIGAGADDVAFQDNFSQDRLAARPVVRVIATGKDGNHGVHNASLVETRNGTLVAAWCSKERQGTRWLDNSPTNTIQVSRSADQGKTWSTPVEAVAPSSNNASFLYDRTSGDLLLIYNWNRSELPDDTTIAVKRSKDDGRTWGEQVIVDTGYPINIIVHSGIVLSNGDWLIPFHGDRSGQKAPFSMQRADYPAAVVISSNHGSTWKRYGAIDVPNALRQPNTTSWAVEPNVAERSDGSLLMILRTRTGRLYESTSNDHGRTWSAARPTLFSNPDAKTGMTALRNGQLVLLWNDTSYLPTRFPLLASLSADGGATWAGTVTISDEHIQTDYPTVIESGGHIRAVYTRALQEVRMVELTADQVRQAKWTPIRSGPEDSIAIADGVLQFAPGAQKQEEARPWLRWSKAVAFRYELPVSMRSWEADLRIDQDPASAPGDAALGIFASYQDEGKWTAWVWQPRNAQAGLVRQAHWGSPNAGRSEESVENRWERAPAEQGRWYRLSLRQNASSFAWELRERDGGGKVIASGLEQMEPSGPFFALGSRNLRVSFDNVVVKDGR